MATDLPNRFSTFKDVMDNAGAMPDAEDVWGSVEKSNDMPAAADVSTLVATDAVHPEGHASMDAALASARSQKKPLWLATGDYEISSPLVLADNDNLIIVKPARLIPSASFTGGALVEVGTLSTRVENVSISGSGTIDCEGNADYCIDFVQAKFSQFSSLRLDGAVISPVKLGDDGATDKTYGIIGYDIESMNVQAENDVNSIALNAERCTDSYFGKMRLTGYRKGVYVSTSSASIELEQVHPWGREVHGAMTHAFDIEGSATLVNCYADTPYDMISGGSSTLYGFKLSAKTMATCCKVFMSDDISSNAEIDDRVVPIHFDGDTQSQVSVFRVYGGTSSRRYKTIATGDTVNNKLSGVIAGSASIYVAPPTQLVNPESSIKSARACGKLFAKIKQATGDCNVLICSDSTTNDSTSWQYKFAQWLFTYYPTHTVNYYAWNDGTNVYNSATVIGTGSGAKIINIYSAAVSGTKTQYLQGVKFASAIRDITLCDLVVLDYGKNMIIGDAAANTPFIRTPAFIALAAQVMRVHSGAGLILTAQNPNRTDSTMDMVINAVYDAAGLLNADVMDVHSYYQSANKSSAFYGSGDIVNQNEAGNELYLQALTDVIGKQYLPKPALNPLDNAGNLAIANCSFSALTANVPDGWSLGSGTAATDSTNYASKKAYSVNLSGVASASYIKYAFSTAEKNALKGKWITVSALVRVPAGNAITAGRVALFLGSGVYLYSYATDNGQDGFKWVSVSYLVPSTVGTLEIRLYGDTTSVSSDDASFDRCIVTTGRLPADVGI